VATFSACAVTTIFWFAPIFLLAILKLLLPIESVRGVLSRWIMLCGEYWVGGNAIIYGMKDPDRVDVRGIEDLSTDKWYLVMANHQTWVDIIVLQVVLNRHIPFLKFFIKQELIWFPILGIAWWAMDMPFMKRYSKSYLARHPEKKGKDFEVTRRACGKFRNTPTTVFNFVEGTRCTPEKQARRNSRFKNLLPPRAIDARSKNGWSMVITRMIGSSEVVFTAG
jgi:1-acyl-sn-glycerol-3-phosphate acyltransferase